MTVSSLRQVITGKFIQGLTKQSKASNSSAAINRNSADAASLDVSLRTGARNLGQGLQALNIGITYINVSRDVNEKLLDVVTKLELLVSKGAKGVASGQNEGLMQQEFQGLATEFQKLVRNAKIQGNDVLDVTALSEVMVRGGVDPEASSELGAAFDKIEPVATGDKEAPTTSSGAIIPLNQFANALRRTSAQFAQAQESGEPIDGLGAAFKPVRDTLSELREKLQSNIKALNQASDVVAKNIDVVRAAGLAMLDLSSSIKGNEDPETIARIIQEKIRKGAPGALAEASNINSIMVAGFSLTSDTFKSISKKSSS
jgi:hypothetical protein